MADLEQEGASAQEEEGEQSAEGSQGRSPEQEVESSREARRKRKLQARLHRLQETYRKRGIVYISRIPPHMKPQKLRQMLSQHGEVCRLYLAPEDPGLRRQRKRTGKDTGKNFCEGWVEFEDKRVARETARRLNGEQMGGRRRSAYHYDLWCLKYLPGFKWDALTEEVAYQRAVREQRVAAEVAAARRERDFYLGRVDAAKAQAAQQERRLKRQAQAGAAGGASGAGEETPAPSSAAPPAAREEPQGEPGTSGGGGAAAEGRPRKVLRVYGQRRPRADPGAEGADVRSTDFLRLLAGRMRQRTAEGPP